VCVIAWYVSLRGERSVPDDREASHQGSNLTADQEEIATPAKVRQARNDIKEVVSLRGAYFATKQSPTQDVIASPNYGSQ
jgi:hypothetical protein